MMDRLSVIKKLNKPLIERRRRERINHHIEELNRLIVQPLLRHRRSIRKLEKADILEITVEYLKMCARNRLPVTMPPSPSSDGSPQNLDVISQQISQLDGLATLHHLLIENGEGGDIQIGGHQQGVGNAFIPFAAAAAAAAAACGGPLAADGAQFHHHHHHHHNSNNNNNNSNNHLHRQQSTTPSNNNFLSQSSSADDEENDTSPSKRSPSASSGSSSGRKSVSTSEATTVGDLLMIAPTPSASSSSNSIVAAGGSMWRPW